MNKRDFRNFSSPQFGGGCDVQGGRGINSSSERCSQNKEEKISGNFYDPLFSK